MNDQLSNPYPADKVAELPISAARQDLLEEIMATTDKELLDHDTAADPGYRRRRWLVAAAAAAAITALLTLPLWIGDDGGRTGSDVAIAPSAAGERAVLDATGWRIVHLMDEGDGSELQYAKGRQRLDIFMLPAGDHDAAVDGRAEELGEAEPVTVLGRPSKLWAYRAIDHTTISSPHGQHFFEVRGYGMSKAAYLALLRQLRQVDDAAFEEATAEYVVTPEEVPAMIDEALADVETPAGFDPGSIEVEGYSQRHTVVSAVAEEVNCGWVTQWSDAIDSGDDAAKQEAIDAMVGSKNWRSLGEERQNSRELADQMVDPTVPVTTTLANACQTW